jgi:hypothetical protein
LSGLPRAIARFAPRGKDSKAVDPLIACA